MTLKNIDFTGMAYLTVIGLAGLVAYGIYRQAQGAGTAAADAVSNAVDALNKAAATVGTAVNPADPGNLINTAVTGAVSGMAGRDTSVGSLIADVFPSSAEINANFSMQPDQGWVSGYDLAFPAPPFVGNIPEDPEQPAIFYRPISRTLH
jgi:hypothetical protein